VPVGTDKLVCQRPGRRGTLTKQVCQCHPALGTRLDPRGAAPRHDRPSGARWGVRLRRPSSSFGPPVGFVRRSISLRTVGTVHVHISFSNKILGVVGGVRPAKPTEAGGFVRRRGRVRFGAVPSSFGRRLPSSFGRRAGFVRARRWVRSAPGSSSFGRGVEFVLAGRRVRSGTHPDGQGLRNKCDRNLNSVRSAEAPGGDRRIAIGVGSSCQRTTVRSECSSLSSVPDAPPSCRFGRYRADRPFPGGGSLGGAFREGTEGLPDVRTRSADNSIEFSLTPERYLSIVRCVGDRHRGPGSGLSLRVRLEPGIASNSSAVPLSDGQPSKTFTGRWAMSAGPCFSRWTGTPAREESPGRRP
jgi:hypothetical protein